MKRYQTGANTGRTKTKYTDAVKRLAKLRQEVDKFDMKHGVQMSTECVAAFVVFNCEDSKRACVRDYDGSGGSWNLWWQPPPLRFGPKKVPITVTTAPEPSDIIWENLEITASSRLLRQMLTYGVMLALLIGSIIALAVAQVCGSVSHFASLYPVVKVADHPEALSA